MHKTNANKACENANETLELVSFTSWGRDQNHGAGNAGSVVAVLALWISGSTFYTKLGKRCKLK